MWPIARRQVWAVAVLAQAAVTVLLAACSANPVTAPDTGDRQVDAELSGPAAGPQPYDIFRGEDMGVIDYAVLQLRDECLVTAGYTYTRDQGAGRRPSNPFAALRVTAGTFGIPTQAQAETRGFGGDMSAEPPSLISSDTNFDVALDRCTKEVWQRLGADAQNLVATYHDLGNQLASALAAVHTEQPPTTITTKMLRCMEGKGFHVPNQDAWIHNFNVNGFGVEFGKLEDLPGPEWVPKRVPGTVEVSPPRPPRRYVPTEAEQQLAVAWYQCDSDAGLTKWQMERAMKVQQNTVARFEAQFAELNPRIEELARGAAALVGL